MRYTLVHTTKVGCACAFRSSISPRSPAAPGPCDDNDPPIRSHARPASCVIPLSTQQRLAAHAHFGLRYRLDRRRRLVPATITILQSGLTPDRRHALYPCPHNKGWLRMRISVFGIG